MRPFALMSAARLASSSSVIIGNRSAIGWTGRVIAASRASETTGRLQSFGAAFPSRHKRRCRRQCGGAASGSADGRPYRWISFLSTCCNSPGCCHRGGLFPGCAAVGGGPPLPWTFAGGFSTCCISRLPPKCWPGVQQCVELVCDTPHMVYLGQCKRFCNPFIAAARQTDAQWLRAPVR